MGIITRIEEISGNIALLESDGSIVGIVSGQNASCYASKTNENIIYLSECISNRNPTTNSYPIDVTAVTVPAGPWTADTLQAHIAGLIGGNASQDVYVQDQATDALNLHLGNIKAVITVTENTIKDAETVKVLSVGYVPVVGNYLCLQENRKIYQAEILTVTSTGVDSYTLGLSIPLDYAYTTVSGCSVLDVDMQKNGSVTPVAFMIKPKAGTQWHITRLNVIMLLSTAGDDSKFGSINALTKGCYFRKEDGASSQNLFNIKDNSDLRIQGDSLDYTTRSGSGSFGLNSSVHFSGLDNRGVVIRLDGNAGESLKCIVRDNLTGLTRFRIVVHGHVTSE